MMELMIAAGKAVAQLQAEHGLTVERVYTGSFLTSLDTAGNSVVTVALCCLILGLLMERLPERMRIFIIGMYIFKSV